MTVTITPATTIRNDDRLVITVSGSGFSCSATPVAVEFKDPPFLGSAGAEASCDQYVITTRFFGLFQFQEHKSVKFMVPGVANPSAAQAALLNISSSLLSNSGAMLGRDDVGTYPEIKTGSLGANMPSISLSSVVANATFVSLFVSLNPSEFLPVGSVIYISLGAAVPQYLSSDVVLFESPSETTDPTLTPRASASLSSGKLAIRLESGTFLAQQPINFVLPNTVKNALAPQAASSSVTAEIVDCDNVITGKSSAGTMVAIVSGSLGTNAPSISLSNVAKNTGSVTMTISLTPADAVPTGSTLLITLGGSAPQSLSASTVVFTSPGTGSPAAAAGVAGGVLAITITGGALSAGSLIVLTLPGTVTNPTHVQSALGNVASCIISSQVIIASSSTGTHPAVIPPYMPVVFMIDILRD
jgi:hypothetical protein